MMTCLVCNETTTTAQIVAHLAERHPGRFDAFETSPEGMIIVVDTDLAGVEPGQLSPPA